jgi:hypothetical protein
MAARLSADAHGDYVVTETDIVVDTTRRSAASPILNLCGIPLRIQKTGARTANVHNDNQMVTYLCADATSGFAPDFLQGNVGEVILYRQDGVPVTSDDVDDYWVFLSSLMNYDMSEFGDKQYNTWQDIRKSKWFSPEGLAELIAWLRQMEEEQQHS